MTTPIDQADDWFHTYVARVTSGSRHRAQPGVKYNCPCCGYPTLTTRGQDDICGLCGWQDEGQDDPHADEVWGGPNKGYSLTEARLNFKRHWVKYDHDKATRIGGGDCEITLAAKKAMMVAFEAMAGADDTENARHWEAVQEAETVMRQETRRKLDEHAQRMKGQLSPD